MKLEDSSANTLLILFIRIICDAVLPKLYQEFYYYGYYINYLFSLRKLCKAVARLYLCWIPEEVYYISCSSSTTFMKSFKPVGTKYFIFDLQYPTDQRMALRKSFWLHFLEIKQ